MHKCTEKTEVYSRIVGYFRPVQQWNIGKKAEYHARKPFIAGAAETLIPEADMVICDAPVFDKRISGNVAN